MPAAAPAPVPVGRAAPRTCSTFRAVAGPTTYIGKITAHFTNRIMAGSRVLVNVGDTQQTTTQSLSAEYGARPLPGPSKSWPARAERRLGAPEGTMRATTLARTRAGAHG